MPQTATIVFNRDNSFKLGQEDKLSFEDYISTVSDIEKILKKKYIVKKYEVWENTINAVKKIKTDLFFNLSYGIGEIPTTEHLVAKELEKTGRPFTGSNAYSIYRATNKEFAKKIFIKNKVPTPKFIVIKKISQIEKISEVKLPCIIKPSKFDGSIGISNDSVINTYDGIGVKINALLKRYKQPLLVEEYIEGREIRVGCLISKNKIITLPLSELEFGKEYKRNNLWEIDDFDSKNNKNSIQFKSTKVVCPAKVTVKTAEKIRNIAKRAIKSLKGTGYARVDMRLSSKNIPYVLEVNFNPGIGKDDAFVTAAKKAGMSYKNIIDKIIQSAKEKNVT